MNRYQKPYKSHYDLWMIEALLYLRMKLGIFCTGGAIADQSSVIYSQDLHLRSSNETFGIVSSFNNNTVTRPSSVETSIKLFLSNGSTPNLLNKRYKFLARKQESAEGSISASQWVDLAIQWNKSISQPVDGVVIFYKSPEHLKMHYEHWNVKRMMGASIAISSGKCEVMPEELQPPERSRPVLAAQTQSPLRFAISTKDTLASLSSLSLLAPSPLSASLISATPSSSSMPPVPSPSTTVLSHGPNIRRIEPALLHPFHQNPCFL
ncbi:hypothetical protein BDC45DRAFT_569824 [Circinella umbellata]|nr:hypothetical protein BDC45DRAFT_569824 [Circinella umbellata]